MSGKITIVGLGPAGPEQVTLEALAALRQGVAQGAWVCALPHAKATAETLVPGLEATLVEYPSAETERSPLVVDDLVRLLHRSCAASGVPARIVHDMSFVEPMLDCVYWSGDPGLQLVSAWAVAGVAAGGQALASRNATVWLEIEGGGASELSFVRGLLELSQDQEPDGVQEPSMGLSSLGELLVRRPYQGRKDWSDWMQAVGRSQESKAPMPRRETSIVVRDDSAAGGGAEISGWNCFECFPKSWKVSSGDDPTEDPDAKYSNRRGPAIQGGAARDQGTPDLPADRSESPAASGPWNERPDDRGVSRGDRQDNRQGDRMGPELPR